jgi:putative chitinase
MGYIITTDVLTKLFPATSRTTLDAWVEPLRAACRAHDILTTKRIAAFLSQVGHECAGFTQLSENLNYSAAGLAATWPRLFAEVGANGKRIAGKPNALALQLARKPEAIANHAYANRMGNGDVASGDGWRFRGAGPMQLTGRSNHSLFGKTVGKPAEAVPDFARTPAGGALAAAWFWSTNNLNKVCETKSVADVTRIINGGQLGLAEREKLFAVACTACGVPA